MIEVSVPIATRAAFEATEAGDFLPDGPQRMKKELCNRLDRRYDCAEMQDSVMSLSVMSYPWANTSTFPQLGL